MPNKIISRTSPYLNLIKANSDRGEKIKVQAKEDGEADIFIYDVIDSWYGIGPQEIADALAEIKAEVINLHINSPGGNVFDARAIKTALDKHSAKVIAHIDGVAASSASWLPMDCEEIRIARGAMIMIHNSWTFVIGNAKELKREAGLLEKIDKNMAADYVRRSDKSIKEIQSFMAEETWFDADEALAAGLVDSIYEPGKAEENAQASRWDLSAYKNAPKVERTEEKKVEDNRATYENRLKFYELSA